MIRAEISDLAEPVPRPSNRDGSGSRRRPGFGADTSFRAAVREMEAVGLRVRTQPHAGSAPYGVLSGRTGSRFFLLPLRPRAVSTGALALVQPVRWVPRAVKGVASVGARLGLGPLLPHKVHVSGVATWRAWRMPVPATAPS